MNNHNDNFFRVVSVFIAVIFIMVISFWIVTGIFAYKALNQVNDNGVRGLIEQLWCGKNVDCKLPNITE